MCVYFRGLYFSIMYTYVQLLDQLVMGATAGTMGIVTQKLIAVYAQKGLLELNVEERFVS